MFAWYIRDNKKQKKFFQFKLKHMECFSNFQCSSSIKFIKYITERIESESGSLTQVTLMSFDLDKSLITFSTNRRFLFKGTKVNLYLRTLGGSYKNFLNPFKVFLHFMQIFSPT